MMIDSNHKVAKKAVVRQTGVLSSLAAAALLLTLSTARAESNREVFRFREPIVVGNDTEVSSAFALGSSIQVGGTVKESAVALGGDVTVGPRGVVEGDVVAFGGRVVRLPGSQIHGKVTEVPFSIARLEHALAFVIPTLVIGMGAVVGAAIVFGSLGSVALALLVLALFPSQTEAVREQIEAHPGKTFLFGLLMLTFSLPVLVFLTITIIGIPLAFVTAVLLMASLVLGTVGLGQWVGLRLAAAIGKPMRPLLAGLLGLLILTAISGVHFVGVLAQGAIVCMALGSVAFSRFRSANPE